MEILGLFYCSSGRFVLSYEEVNREKESFWNCFLVNRWEWNHPKAIPKGERSQLGTESRSMPWNLLGWSFFILFFGRAVELAGALVSEPGIEPTSSAAKAWVLTAGPTGNSLPGTFYQNETKQHGEFCFYQEHKSPSETSLGISIYSQFTLNLLDQSSTFESSLSWISRLHQVHWNQTISCKEDCFLGTRWQCSLMWIKLTLSS